MAPVRPRVALISLLAGALGACAVDASKPPRLRYAPPEGQSAEAGPAAAGQPAGLVWNQLLDRLIQSPLEVDLADPERGIIVARYSGDPEPYVTCGWILVERGGELEQVPASGQASFKRVVQGRRLEVNRDLNLDARLVVEVKPAGDGAAVETTSNYVLTKTVAVENEAGWTQGRAQEVVSFSSGGRGEFSKGTVCQPNGALESTVLDVLPRATQAVQAEGAGPAAMDGPVAGSGPAARIEVAESAAGSLGRAGRPQAGDERAASSRRATSQVQPADGEDERLGKRQSRRPSCQTPLSLRFRTRRIRRQRSSAQSKTAPSAKFWISPILIGAPIRSAIWGSRWRPWNPTIRSWMAAVSASTSACRTTIRI